MLQCGSMFTAIMTFLGYQQVQDRFNLCVLDEQKSDCNEQARLEQCDKYLSKSTAMISPVFEELIGEATWCSVIPLEDTPLSENVFDLLFPPSLTSEDEQLIQYLKDETTIIMTEHYQILIKPNVPHIYHSRIQSLFIQPILGSACIIEEMQRLFEAAHYASHAIITPIITARFLQRLDDPSNDDQWHYAFINRFWSTFIPKMRFDRRLEILPYLYEASDDILPSICIENGHYDKMIDDQNINQLTTVLKYYKSGAFDDFDIKHVAHGGRRRRPIMIHLAPQRENKVLKLYLQPEWRDIFEPSGEEKPFRALDEGGDTALYVAIEDHNVEGIQLMMESVYGKDIDITRKSPSYESRSLNNVVGEPFEAGSLSYLQIALNEVCMGRNALATGLFGNEERGKKILDITRVMQLLTRWLHRHERIDLFHERNFHRILWHQCDCVYDNMRHNFVHLGYPHIQRLFN